MRTELILSKQQLAGLHTVAVHVHSSCKENRFEFTVVICCSMHGGSITHRPCSSNNAVPRAKQCCSQELSRVDTR